MTTFTKISDLPTTTTLTDNDKFIVETSTGTKACSRSALREAVQITKDDVGLGNCDNTADLDKPISTATQTALNAKLNSSTAASTYLTQTDAASIYLTQNNASGTYLTQTNAATYYLTKTDATTNYATVNHTHSGYASSSHSHVGTDIVLTGYTMALNASAIAATDTVSVALGKLEKTLDGVETLLAAI